MYCKNCGCELQEGDAFCKNCGTKAEEQKFYKAETFENEPAAHEEPPNTTLWIVLGALATFCCCFIGGIVTVVYAAKASGNVSAGNMEEARSNLETAKGWFLASVIIGIITGGISIAAYV